MIADEIDEFEELLEDAEDQASSDWEMSFLDDIRGKYDQYHGNTYVSEAQLRKLRQIAKTSEMD